MTAAPEVLTGLTWEQFLELPENELRHAELINGEVVVVRPTLTHQQIVIAVVEFIRAWIRDGSERGIATLEPPVKITDNRGYCPDVAWFPEERCSAPDEPLAVTGPPALAVEVLSPGTRSFDIVRKVPDYARVGVDELWLIDPDGPQVLVYRRTPGNEQFSAIADLEVEGELTSPLLPGLSIPLPDLTRR